MIKTDEFGGVTVSGMLFDLFDEYDAAGMGIIRSAIATGYDTDTLRTLFDISFDKLMEALEEEDK